jgi:flagellar basal-body rod protein FlgC
MDPLLASMKIAGSGLQAQSLRLRLVSENLANVESTGKSAGSDPYRRKSVSFSNELDRASGVTLVKADEVIARRDAYRLEYQPGHPAADAAGYVKLPDVNMIVEMADMRQANRSYESNLQVIKQAREMISMTIDLLRSQG